MTLLAGNPSVLATTVRIRVQRRRPDTGLARLGERRVFCPIDLDLEDEDEDLDLGDSNNFL